MYFNLKDMVEQNDKDSKKIKEQNEIINNFKQTESSKNKEIFNF